MRNFYKPSFRLIFLLLTVNQQLQALAKEAPSLQISPILEIKDWLAMGSGCQARKDKAGNVNFDVARDENDPLLYHIVFEVDQYRLEGDKPINPQNPTFARECAFRVAAYPKSRWKIENLSLTTGFVVQKDSGSTAEMYTKLLTGSASLNEWSQVFGSQETFAQKQIDLNLTPSPDGRKHLLEGECEAPKIVGADISFVNRRENFTPKVVIAPDVTGKVILNVKLSSCKPREELKS